MARKPITTRMERWLTPAEGAAYTVQHVSIPTAGLTLPQHVVDQWKLTPEHADALRKKAEIAQQPGTWMQPANWTGAAVLLICGAGDNRHAFKWLLFEKLIERGIAVLTVDPPGHGDFQFVTCTTNNVRCAARAASDWLHAQAGVTQTAAVGISFGGAQVADLAAHDDRFAAVALISTPVSLPPVTRWTVARESAGLILPRNLSLLRYQSIRPMWAEWKSMKGVWFGESLYDMIAQLDVLGAIQKMKVPLAVVHGKLDVAVPPSNAKQIKAAASCDCDVIWCGQGTHLSVMLFDKEMRQLADWLADKLKE
jgi:pimeloyl-ACP methyl ester carboxylesterase